MIPARALRPAVPAGGPGDPYAPSISAIGTAGRTSVVVVHHRGADDLIGCLESVFAADLGGDLEVVVVDNASTDGGPARAATLDPRVVSVRLPANLGFAAAASAGMRVATGDHVLLLNPDARVDPGCITALLGAAASADIVTARVLLLDHPDRLDNCGHRLYADGLNWCRGRGDAAAGRFDEPDDVLLFSGAAVLFRRAALVATGGFDPSYFGYGEDADLGLRAARLGLRCVYAPDAVVRHRVGGTFGAASGLKVFLVERNRARVAMTHLPRRRLLASPLWTLARHVALAGASAAGRGPVPNASASAALGLPLAVALGHVAALVDIPGCLARRRRASRRAASGGLSDAQWSARLERDRVTLTELAASGRRA